MGTERPVIQSDAELVALAYAAEREAANQALAVEANRIVYAMQYASDAIARIIGVSGKSFSVRHEPVDNSVRFILGAIEIVARSTHSYWLGSQSVHVCLSAGPCPICSEPLLSLAFGTLADCGVAIASLEESRITGERPTGRFFDKAKCACTKQPEQLLDPQQDAINKLSEALATVLYLGGYPLGGQR